MLIAVTNLARIRAYAPWALVVAIASFSLHAAADAGVPDAGVAEMLDVRVSVEDDAGATPDPEVLPPEQVVNLPPVDPDPEIAPIVVGPEAVHEPPQIESGRRPGALLKTILAVLALILLAYLGGHPRVLELERRLGISQMITAGFPFVVLGLIARTPSVGCSTIICSDSSAHSCASDSVASALPLAFVSARS